MRDHDGALSFAPRLSQRLTRLAFGISFRESRLRVEVTRGRARYSLLQGPALQISHHGETITVSTDQPAGRPIPKIAAGKPPVQPAGRCPRPRWTRDAQRSADVQPAGRNPRQPGR
jgi:alpha,alpha-trehalose phosphorylase